MVKALPLKCLRLDDEIYRATLFYRKTVKSDGFPGVSRLPSDDFPVYFPGPKLAKTHLLTIMYLANTTDAGWPLVQK
jgi:hypothetical protein